MSWRSGEKEGQKRKEITLSFSPWKTDPCDVLSGVDGRVSLSSRADGQDGQTFQHTRHRAMGMRQATNCCH